MISKAADRLRFRRYAAAMGNATLARIARESHRTYMRRLLEWRRRGLDVEAAREEYSANLTRLLHTLEGHYGLVEVEEQQGAGRVLQ